MRQPSSWRSVLALLSLTVALGAAEALARAVSATNERADSPLVDVAWLRARLGDPKVRIVDMASEPDDYRKGHVPGAVYLHVDDARVAVRAGGYRLPTPDEAARLFGTLGIGPDTMVAIYDDAGGLHAARLYLTLDVFGHDRVAIVDGGVQAWQRAGHAVTTDVPHVPRTTYTVSPRGDRVASAEWVRERLGKESVCLIDTRTPEEYAGKDVRAKRGGHIPGAVNVEWKEHLRPDLTLKPVDELRRLYTERGITPDKTVVTYCQTHHRAAHTYFVLRLLGYPRVVAYDRSWAEWGNRPDLPAAR